MSRTNRTQTEIAILQSLIRGPSYGLQIIERVEKMTGGDLTLSQARVYPALSAMEDDGLVEMFVGDEPIPERGGRPRRYFKLTAEGMKTAKQDRAVAQGLFGLVPAKVRALIGLAPGVP